MNRSARRIELPEFKSLNDDELYYLHRLRKYGSGEFKKKLASSILIGVL